MNIPALEPTEADIAGYGKLIRAEGREPDAVTQDFSFWDGLGELLFSRGSVGLVRSYPHSRHVCPNLERHERTSEMIVPVDGDVAVVCALSQEDDARRVDTNTVRAFVVRRGEALILHPGVWHYAPMVQETATDSFIIFEQDTPSEDLLKEAFNGQLTLEVLF
jgi:ureidoglycolate hydrolase